MERGGCCEASEGVLGEDDADSVAADRSEVGEEVGERVRGVPVRGRGAAGRRAGGGGAGRGFDGVGRGESRVVGDQQLGESLKELRAAQHMRRVNRPDLPLRLDCGYVS